MAFPLKTFDLKDSLYRVRTGTFGLVPDTELFTAPWGNTLRINGPRHMRWIADLEMAPQFDDGTEDRRMSWDVDMARAMGGHVAMRLWHPARIYPRGAGAGIYRNNGGPVSLGGSYTIDGSYLIDGAWRIDGGSTIAYVEEAAGRYADSVVMNGLWPSSTVFHPGDHFGLGGNLYMVSDHCESDAAGKCRVPFLWKLWRPALAGDRIDLKKPTARFVLANKESGTQQYSTVFGAASLSAIEVPYVE